MYLLFDIGGTNMRLAVSPDGENITDSKIVPTLLDFNEAMQNLKAVADELRKNKQIHAAAGGVAGPLDRKKTMLVACPQMPDWTNKPLKADLEKIFGAPVILENDTAAGGIGEAVHGAGANFPTVAYLALGTGVGGKRIVEGKIDKSSFNFEPGHMIIVPDGKPCNCGGKGHFESYVGGTNIGKIYGQKAEEISDSAIWDEITRYLAIALNNLTVLWKPDIFVLGGSVSRSIPLEKVNTYLKESVKIYPQVPPVVCGTLNHDAGLYGALELIRC